MKSKFVKSVKTMKLMQCDSRRLYSFINFIAVTFIVDVETELH